MTKAYIVKEVYRHYSEQDIGICQDIELAGILKQRSENRHDLKDSEITSEIWASMVEIYEENPDNALRPLCEVLYELFPEYSVADIDKAYTYYEHRDYLYTYIVEIDMFTNEFDIMSYGTNS